LLEAAGPQPSDIAGPGNPKTIKFFNIIYRANRNIVDAKFKIKNFFTDF
jgi:hypothetical protein